MFVKNFLQKLFNLLTPMSTANDFLPLATSSQQILNKLKNCTIFDDKNKIFVS